MVFKILTELLDKADYRDGGSVAQSADGVAHDLVGR
jgi:hypothetical protein